MTEIINRPKIKEMAKKIANLPLYKAIVFFEEFAREIANLYGYDHQGNLKFDSTDDLDVHEFIFDKLHKLDSNGSEMMTNIAFKFARDSGWQI